MKKSEYKKAKDKAWAELSRYIRLKASNWKGECQCVSCKEEGITTIKPYKEMQTGHFMQGRHMAVMFDERNCAVQCFACNMQRQGCKSGNLYYYGKYMEKTYGKEVIQELERLNKTIKKYAIPELLSIRDKYKELNKNLITNA